jgi:hypothetical protein
MNDIDISIGSLLKSGKNLTFGFLAFFGVAVPFLYGFAGKDFYSFMVIDGIFYDIGAKAAVIVEAIGPTGKPEPVLKTPTDTQNQ